MDIKQGSKRVWHFLWHEDSMASWAVNVVLAFVLIKFILYPGIGLVLGTSLPVVAVVSGSMDHSPEDGMLCGETALAGADFWELCGEAYEERFNITEDEFRGFPLSGGFNKGDIMLLKGTSPESIEVGEVVVFQAGKQYPIIHRVVERWEEDGRVYVATMGDHNNAQIEEYAIAGAGRYWQCYQRIGEGIQFSPCGPGVPRVTESTPGAIRLLDETRIPADELIGEAWGRLPLVGWVKIWFVELLELIGLQRVAQAF